LFAALALLAALFAAACGGGTKVEPVPDPEPEAEAEAGVVETPPPGATTVDVTLREWAIDIGQTSLPAGETYFLATNAGAEAHEMVVIRTDDAPDALPNNNGKVPEEAVDMLGEIEPFSPGSKASTVLELTPGHYVMICNIVEVEENGDIESHYLEGMRTEFTVQ
jgi:uncharacterized cupredoxin-like copper-binding protein